MGEESESQTLALQSRYVVGKPRHFVATSLFSGAAATSALLLTFPLIILLNAFGLVDQTVASIIFGFSVVPFLGWAWGHRRQQALRARLAHASQHAAVGELETAGRELDAICDQAQSLPRFHRSAVGMRAYVYTLTGDLQVAQQLFEEVGRRSWHSRWTEGPHPGQSWMLRGLATCRALNGEIEKAAATLQEARHALHGKDEAQLLIPETVLALRRGKPQGLIDRLNGTWRRAELSLHAADLRALRILRGFALERQREGNYRTGITENDIQAELHAARPFAEGEYDYLGVAWPEMQDFLRRNRFVE